MRAPHSARANVAARRHACVQAHTAHTAAAVAHPHLACPRVRALPSVRLRDRLRTLVGEWAGPTDWFGLGVPQWLAERTERLGFAFPTEVRRRFTRRSVSAVRACVAALGQPY
jgi:hypothetical protein